MREISPTQEALFQIAEAIDKLADVHRDIARALQDYVELQQDLAKPNKNGKLRNR